MIKRLKSKVKTQLQHWGWFTQWIPALKIQYFPTGKHLAKHLLSLESTEAYEEFKRLSSFITDANNIRYYEAVLCNLYPSRVLLPEKAKFVAKGNRANRNRYIKVGGKDFFEKNYSHYGHELESIQAFENHLYPLLSANFKLPRLQQVFKGQFCSLLYFDYIELESFDAKNKEEVLFKYVHNLYNFSIEKEKELNTIDFPAILLDYEKLFFTHNIQKANVALEKEGIDAKKISRLIATSKRVLSHGDLHIENVYRHNTLIDLDNFGYYPIGMDAAFIYMFYFEERPHHFTFKNWANKHFKTIIHSKDWVIFERNFMYYILLFLHMRKDLDHYPKLLEEVMDYLKKEA